MTDQQRERIAEALYIEYMRGRYYTEDSSFEDFKRELPDVAQSYMDKADKLLGHTAEPAENMVDAVAIKLHAFVVNQKAVPWKSEIEEIKEDCRNEARSILTLCQPELRVMETGIRRFTMFRKLDISATHDANQANPPSEPQFEGVRALPIPETRWLRERI